MGTPVAAATTGPKLAETLRGAVTLASVQVVLVPALAVQVAVAPAVAVT